MTVINLAQIEKIIADVARTEIMPRFRKLGSGDVEMKGVNDPVTVADKAAEKALIARLTDAYPGSVVVGEESFETDPQIVSHFSGDKDVWVIDPIDGTRNFVGGNKEFGTMIALVRNRRTVAAWIHDPNSGDTLMGEKGGGVWLGGHKMRLASHDPSVTRLGIIGTRLKKVLDQLGMKTDNPSLPKLVTGSAAAFDYGRLFIGDKIFANSNAPRASYLVYRQSKPWDHAPGLLLLEEAGGYAADLLGTPYDYGQSNKGLLVAPNFQDWGVFQKAFTPILDNLRQG